MYTWLKAVPPGINEKLDGLTQERAEELLKHISPLVRDEGVLSTIKQPDIFKEAFNWDPEFIGPFEGSESRFALIETYHRCGYHGLFKPSIGEVLAQIPEQLINEVVAFETRFGDDGAICDAPGFYGHRATTILYLK